MNFRKEDFLFLLNALFLILMIIFVYYPYNRDRIAPEFVVIYGVLISLGLILAWKFLVKNSSLPWNVLILLQVGLLLHFLGGIRIDGRRVYTLTLVVRYDKLVHFYNCLAAYWGLGALLRHWRIQTGKFEPFILVLMTLGCGAIVEIIEFLGVRTLTLDYPRYYPENLESLYDNNMEDLVADFLGALFAWVGTLARTRLPLGTASLE
ncbi:MAG: hypothetical protein V1816_23130 [Pseudomonadota bacterium]